MRAPTQGGRALKLPEEPTKETFDFRGSNDGPSPIKVALDSQSLN
jgi:hypothetical protein